MGPPLVTLDLSEPFWERFFTVAPLVLVGTREPDGGHDLAPKHLCTPLSWEGWFGFVCAPTHRTWVNARRTGAFTVSFVGPEQIVAASLAAGPRYRAAGGGGPTPSDDKPSLAAIPVIPAEVVDGVLVEGCGLYLECALDRVIDGFGPNGLIVGRVVAVHVHQDVLRAADRDDGELIARHPLLVYAHPDRFGALATTHAFPYPLGFRR